MTKIKAESVSKSVEETIRNEASESMLTAFFTEIKGLIKTEIRKYIRLTPHCTRTTGHLATLLMLAEQLDQELSSGELHHFTTDDLISYSKILNYEDED